MERHAKTQWHPEFVSAIKLELIADRNMLEYTSEKTLRIEGLTPT